MIRPNCKKVIGRKGYYDGGTGLYFEFIIKHIYSDGKYGVIVYKSDDPYYVRYNIMFFNYSSITLLSEKN